MRRSGQYIRCGYTGVLGILHSTVENGELLKILEAIWNFLFNVFGYSSEAAGSESVSREGYCNLFGRPQETNTGGRELQSKGAKQ